MVEYEISVGCFVLFVLLDFRFSVSDFSDPVGTNQSMFPWYRI